MTIPQLKDSDSFCVMPWVHLHISMNGDMNACCLVTKPFGNVKTNSISEIWNGDEINSFRNKLLNNIKDERCNYCYFKESSGGLSLRQQSNKNYFSHFLSVSANIGQKESNEAYPAIYWDIRFSNVCNFRCRTCNHEHSSRWFTEAVLLGETTSSKPIIKAIDDFDKFYTQIGESIDIVEEIYFAGGEPLIMEEHFKIIEILEEKQAFNKYLRYNTNFSKFKYKNLSIFDIWNKFDKVFVGASLDGWDKRGEFLRKEQNWDEVLENRKLMKEICPRVTFAVAVTVSVFNIFHISDFHKKLISEGFIETENFILDNLLQTPNYYNMQILPIGFKLEIKEKIEAHIAWLKSKDELNFSTKKYDVVSEQFQNCIDYLFSNDLSDLVPQFLTKCHTLDGLRNEKISSIFPELEFLF